MHIVAVVVRREAARRARL